MKNTYAQKYNFASNNSIGLIPWNVDFLEEIELLAQSLCKKYAHFSVENGDNFDTYSNDYNANGISDAFGAYGVDTNAPENYLTGNYVTEDYATNKHNVVLVFPHGRPRRYLEDRYKKMAMEAGKAHILPHIITGNEFLSLCLSHWEREQTPYEELQVLDRISLLHEAVILVAKDLPESAVLRRLVEVTEKEKELYREKKSLKQITTLKENKDSTALNEHKVDGHEGMYSHEYMDEKSLSMSKFFPWAHSLDALFEECFQQLIDVIDIVHAEGEVSAFAAALLSALRAIHTEYIQLLKSDMPLGVADRVGVADYNFEVPTTRASTPAFSAYRAAQFIEAYSTYINTQEKGLLFEFAAQRIDTIGVNSWSEEERHVFFDNFMPEIFRDKIIIFAGFVRLTEAEDTLYKYFWKNGASFVWHSDPALADSLSSGANENLDNTENTDSSNDTHKALYSKLHYSCADHLEWLQRWKAHCMLLCEPRKEKPRIHFYAAYDAHSQIEALKSDLKNCVETLSEEREIEAQDQSAQAVNKGNNSNNNGRGGNASKNKSSHGLLTDVSAGDLAGVLADVLADVSAGDLPDDLTSVSAGVSAGDLTSGLAGFSAIQSDTEDEISNLYNSVSDDTLAVLLPKASLLMPILHALPEKDINISMGYPINRTLLGQFIELIIRLQENKQTKSKSEMYLSVTSRHNKNNKNIRDDASNDAFKGVETAHYPSMNDDIAINADISENSALENSNFENNATENNAIENNAVENRTWYVWKDILSLLRHPYARMLMPYDSTLVCDNLAEAEKESCEKNENYFDAETAEKEKTEWRSLLYHLEKTLREGNVSLNIDDFLDDVLGDIDNKNFTVSDNLDVFISEFFKQAVGAWEHIHSLYDVAYALESFIDFLLKHGSILWQSFPLDAEALVRCVETIVPALRDNSLAHEYLPMDALFTVFRQLFNAERIPFEADPLSGMQILGMLESRLLRFRKIFIMDMTEDNLPGIIQQDALMPDSLRNLLSLPDTHKREILTAHTFYRLIAGAEDVWLYWQEGIQASEIQSSKSLRSRFVEECLWEEEKKKGHLITNEEVIKKGDLAKSGEVVTNEKLAKKGKLAGNDEVVKNEEIVLRTADCRPKAPLRQDKKIIPCTAFVKSRIRSFFEKPLSSSALDTYIHCPAKFFYTYLGELREMDEVNEGDDSRELGMWLHQLLQDTYKDFIGQSFEHNPKNFEILLDLFHTRLHSPEVAKFISPESYFMLARAGEYHLTNYWESMPYIIQPMSLENKYECDVPSSLFAHNSLGITKIKLQGRFDRVDMRLAQDVAAEMAEEMTENMPEDLIDYRTYGFTENISQNISQNPDELNGTHEGKNIHTSDELNGIHEGENTSSYTIDYQQDDQKTEQFLITDEIFKLVEKELAASTFSPDSAFSSASHEFEQGEQGEQGHLNGFGDRGDLADLADLADLNGLGEKQKFCTKNFLAGVEHWILDYKTGKGQKINKKIWANTTFWDAIKKANQEQNQCVHDDILQEISMLMPNIQLPFYLYVYGQNFPQILCNAGWIFLGEEKKEVPLVEISLPKPAARKTPRKPSAKKNNASAAMPDVSDTSDASTASVGDAMSFVSWELLHAIKTTFMPELLEFSLNHLLQAQSFKAVEGKSCNYCPHKDYC